MTKWLKQKQIAIFDPKSPNNPFTKLILDFKGKELPSDQIEFDYNIP